MFIEAFVREPVLVSRVTEAIAMLDGAGAFQVFLEIAAKRSAFVDPTNLLQHAAMQSSYHRGYVECLEDMKDFYSRYVAPTLSTNGALSHADFGAGAKLINDEVMTREEYERLRRGR